DEDIKLACRRCMEDGTALEFDHRISSGRWFHVYADPHETGIALYYREITEAKTAEQALREREAELSDFFVKGNVALHWVAPDGKILWANHAELDMLGYTTEEYVGRNIRDFHIDPLVIEDILARLAGSEKLHNYEARLRRKDGSIRHVAITSSAY